MSKVLEPPSDAWSCPLQTLLDRLGTTPQGLPAADVARRLAIHGDNCLQDRPRQRAVTDFIRRFMNPMVLILLGAVGISALTRQQTSFIIIVLIMTLSITLDFIQEYRATAAVDRLRDRVALRVTALRDQAPRDILATELIPGDVIVLQAGNLVPADARLIEARDLLVNEALLTGEPYPAEKCAADLPSRDAAGIIAPANAIFMGCSIVSGTAKALVVATGRTTQLGGIAGDLRNTPPPTALALGIRDFGMLIMRLTVLLVLFVLMVNLFFHRPLVESFLFALALAVGLTPELLPMVVSVTLARGAVRMAHKQVIVRRLSAVHDLGSMDVLCSDKTGTLTEARIKLVRGVDIEGNDSSEVLRWAHINAAFETGLKSPLDDAILEANPVELTGWHKIDEVPFDFERRRVSILAAYDTQRYLIVKGAPENVLALADTWQQTCQDRPLDTQARAAAHATLERLGADGFRLLGVAWRKVEPGQDHAAIADESKLTFAGLIAFQDPPKQSAREAVQALSGLGVSVKVLTGDNEWVTRHVCAALGIQIREILTGQALAQLTDDALSAKLARTTLFCRVTPSQKARVIRLLHARGHVVGHLGDGINDAPSLRTADVGLSVESAADVAKDAAAMILLQQDLNVVVDGVREGRRAYANIMKYVMMATSSNFGNMFSMAGAALLLPFLPMLPMQVLLNNLLYDLSELAIPLDNVDHEMIDRPFHWDMALVRNFMLVFGAVSSLFDFLTFGLLLWVFQVPEALFQTAWFVESLLTQVLVIFIIRTVARPWNSHPHPALTASSLGVASVSLLLPFTALGRWLGFVPLPIPVLASLVCITVTYLAVTHELKRRFFTNAIAFSLKYARRARPLSHTGL